MYFKCDTKEKNSLASIRKKYRIPENTNVFSYYFHYFLSRNNKVLIAYFTSECNTAVEIQSSLKIEFVFYFDNN